MSELLAVWYFLFPQVSRLLLERASATATGDGDGDGDGGSGLGQFLNSGSRMFLWIRACKTEGLSYLPFHISHLHSFLLSLSLSVYVSFCAASCLSLFPLLVLRPLAFNVSLLPLLFRSLEHFKDFSAGPLRRVNTRYKMLFAAVRRLRGGLALKGEAPLMTAVRLSPR